MQPGLWATAAAVFALVFSGYQSRAAADEFFKGKTVTFIVGYAAGGGYDTFTRAVSRHMGKHIPGNPSMIVENKPGAGSLIAANFVYNRSKPDGLTIGVFGSGLVTQQALESKGLRFDARKFNWLGSVSKGTPICAIMGFTGLKTLDDVLSSKKELKLGSTGAGSTTDDLPNLMRGLMDAPFKVVRGYGGTSKVRVAMQRRELDGACWTWESMRTTARAMLNAEGDDKLIPYVIQGKYKDAEVKDLPQFTEAIKDKDKLTAFKAWLNPYVFFRPAVLPPETPSERVQALRTALKKTMEDPEFLAEAKKSKLDADYTSGEEIEKLVDEIMAISPKAREVLASILAPEKK